MVWRNKHRAGRRKRERIAALQKRPTIIAIETGHYIDQAKQQLRRAAWRAQHANRPIDHDIEIIDLTQESDGHRFPNAQNEPNLLYQQLTRLKLHNFLTESNNTY